MRRSPLIAVPLILALWVAAAVPGLAQQSSQSGQSGQSDQSSQPSGDAAQQPASVPPQKKKAGKKEASHKKALEKPASSPAPAASSQTTAPGQSASGDSQKAVAPQSPTDGTPAAEKGAGNANPFPEDVSRRAAQAAASSAAVPSATAPSAEIPSAPAPATGKSNPNPFPEAVSRRAAEAAGNTAPAAETQTAPALPPGVSSSNSVTLENLGNSPASDRVTVTDPVRAKKDTKVGDFYLSRGDAKGAYMRYKDALAYDPANMDAVYGLAESALRLKKFSEAERNYKIYLQVIPTGSKSKQAAKELLALANQK